MWLYSFDAGKQIIECLRECQDYLLDLLNKRLLLLNPMKFGPDKGFILRNGPSGLSTKPRLLNLLPKLSSSRGNECVWSWSKEVNKELSNTSYVDRIWNLFIFMPNKIFIPNFCWALPQNPAQLQPSQTQIPISSKGTGADTKILLADLPHTLQ